MSLVWCLALAYFVSFFVVTLILIRKEPITNDFSRTHMSVGRLKTLRKDDLIFLPDKRFKLSVSCYVPLEYSRPELRLRVDMYFVLFPS